MSDLDERFRIGDTRADRSTGTHRTSGIGHHFIRGLFRRQIMVKRTIAYVVAAVLGCCAAFPVLAQNVKVKVGYIPVTDWLPALVAKEKGYFEARKLDVTLTRIAVISNIPPAIFSGDLQIGTSTATVMFDAAEGGLDLVALAGGTRFTAKAPVLSLVGRAGQKIDGARDLEGRKVGVPGLRSVVDVLVRKWLLVAGVQASKVTFIEAPFPQMRDMLKAGTLDAVAVLEPFRSRMIGDGTGFKVADFAAEINPNILGGMWVAKAEWASANPLAVKAFRDGLSDAIDFITRNPAEARAIELKYLGFNAPVLPPYQNDITEADLQLIAGFAKEVNLLRKPIDAGKLIAR
jgi:NitT/TauT family transport system substrate-binding protein